MIEFTIPRTIIGTQMMVCEFAKSICARSMLEIGVAGGGLSKNIMANTDVEFFMGVDPYHDPADTVTYNQVGNLSSAVNVFKSSNKNCVLLQGTIHDIRCGSFDFIYIDGDHSIGGIYTDYNLIKRNINYHLIGGHDFKNGTGVKPFITETIKSDNLVIINDKSSNHWLDISNLDDSEKDILLNNLRELSE